MVNQDITIPAGSNVLYTKVNTDTSGGYDPSTGVYTVPSSGIYLFHVFR